MNIRPNILTGFSVCPHDCPSACAVEVEVLDKYTIGRVRGAKDQTYTAGVVCEKVARYAERVHHPDRLMKPLKRKGAKGSGAYVGGTGKFEGITGTIEFARYQLRPPAKGAGASFSLGNGTWKLPEKK